MKPLLRFRDYGGNARNPLVLACCRQAADKKDIYNIARRLLESGLLEPPEKD